MQTCSHCGCENPDGIAYCRDCGMTLRAQPPRVAAPTPTPELAAAAGLIPAPYAPPAYAPPPVPASSPAPIAAPVPAPQMPLPAPVPVHAAAAPPQPVAGPPGPPGPGNTLRSEQAQSLEVACPRCHERNPVESRFCHSCGYAVGSAAAPGAPAPVAGSGGGPGVGGAPSSNRDEPHAPPSAPVCGRCRGTNDPGSDFCKFCGARLAAAAPVLSPSPLAEPTDPNAALPKFGAQQAFPNIPAALANAPIPAHTAMVVEGRAAQPAAPTAPPAGGPVPGSPFGGPGGPETHPSRPGFAAVQAPVLGAETRPHQGIGEIVRAHIVRIAKDGSEGVHHPITSDVTDVGRTEGQILLPDDPYLSPRHARIVARPAPAVGARAALSIIDLGSVNGVFVRLRAPHALVHGDLLLLGQQVLRFEAVTEIEGARGPAMQHGVLLFGSPAPVTRARLVQRTVEGLVRDVIYVVRDELVFGRETGDRTFPEDVFMSRRHASIRRDAAGGGGFVLHDLGSSNGTFVQITGEHPLLDGDQFRIGHHLFRVDVPLAPGGGAGGGSAGAGGVS